jgi:hypothetical protein
MKGRAAVEREDYPAATLCVDPMTTLRSQPNEGSLQKQRFGIGRTVRRGSLGMNFDRSSQNLLTERSRTLFSG